MSLPPQEKKDLNRFVGVQRILIFSLLIIALVILAVNFLPQGNEDSNGSVTILDPAADVRGEDNSLFGNIRIITADGLSLAYAKVLINGIDYGNLGKGELLLRVYPGDTISIDGSAYQRQLLFQIRAVSSNISREFLQTDIVTDGNIAEAGIIVFK